MRPWAGRRQRRPQVFPPPERSGRIYVRLAPRDVAYFKFILEACDNLGYMTVVDKYAAILSIIYSPFQEEEVIAFLTGVKTEISVDFFKLK